MDPAPSACLGPVSGSLLESRPPRAAHPDRPSCVAVPYDRRAGRHGEPRLPRSTGITHWLLAHCSVLKVRAPTRRKGLQRWGRATRNCKHAAVRRQPPARARPRRHDFCRPAAIRAAGNRGFPHLAGARGSGIGSKQHTSVRRLRGRLGMRCAERARGLGPPGFGGSAPPVGEPDPRSFPLSGASSARRSIA